MPPHAGEPVQVLNVWRSDPAQWPNLSASTETFMDTCWMLESQPNPQVVSRALLRQSDRRSGSDDYTGRITGWVEDHTCEYGEYQKFGERSFPRVVRCFDGGTLKSEIRVLDLSVLNNSKPELFTQPVGAEESVNCIGPLNAPKPVYDPDPKSPRPEGFANPVALGLTVGKDGIPRDIKVLRSIDKDFDKAAVDAVRGWKFEPGNCDGNPVETQIGAQIKFELKRNAISMKSREISHYFSALKDRTASSAR